jgi:hypothetical protein
MNLALTPDVQKLIDERVKSGKFNRQPDSRRYPKLARFPGLGHTRPDVADKRYLFWAEGKYVIAYRLEDEELVVIRVLHGARDFRKIFPRKD